MCFGHLKPSNLPSWIHVILVTIMWHWHHHPYSIEQLVKALVQGLADRRQSKDLSPGPARFRSLESYSCTAPHPPPAAAKVFTSITSLVVHLGSAGEAEKALLRLVPEHTLS